MASARERVRASANELHETLIVNWRALDRFPALIVSAIAMGLPSIGLLYASNLDAPAVLTFPLFLWGLSCGAQHDLVGYLVSRNFNVLMFSSVLGLMATAIAAWSAAGAIVKRQKVTSSFLVRPEKTIT